MICCILCLSSFFGDFGFGFGGSQQHEKETQKGGDVVMDLDVTLEELYIGTFVEVRSNATLLALFF